MDTSEGAYLKQGVISSIESENRKSHCLRVVAFLFVRRALDRWVLIPVSEMSLRRPYGTLFPNRWVRFPHASQSVTKLYYFGFDSWEDACMGYIRGESRGQEWLFPLLLDELIPSDHICRVIDAV